MVEYKIEYDNILYPEIDDKRHALVELIDSMKKSIKEGYMEDLVTIKRRDEGRWVTVYKGSFV